MLPSVTRAFSLVNEGIYFIPGPGADGKSSIQFLSFATAKVKMVAPISGPPAEGLSVSPDGRSILFSQFDEARQRPDAGGELPVGGHSPFSGVSRGAAPPDSPFEGGVGDVLDG